MVQKSLHATNEFINLGIIDIIIQNENAYSNISQKLSFYILANILKDLNDKTFFQFLMIISNELKAEKENEYDNSLKSNHTFIGLIERETKDEKLQIAAFHFLFAICYRITLSPVNDISMNVAGILIEKIFSNYNDICLGPKPRYELYRSVFNLCCQFPSFSGVIYQDKEKMLSFLGFFKSSDPNYVTLALNFFSLLFSQAPNEEVQCFIINIIPWKSLLTKILNDKLEWRKLFFLIIDQMATSMNTAGLLFHKGIYSDLIECYDNYSAETRIYICKIFINVLLKLPPNECLLFIKLNVYQIFFDLLESDDDALVNHVLDCLHSINEKLLSIDQISVALHEYEKYDALHVLQDLKGFEYKAQSLCKEVRLI